MAINMYVLQAFNSDFLKYELSSKVRVSRSGVSDSLQLHGL